MDSDLDIARAAKPAAIEKIAKQLNLDRSDLILQGPYIAKISWKALQKNITNKQGSLVLVTSVNPTPFGEGKTVTTIGLNQGLNKQGHNACCVIREPSLGPVFGIKGGAAGGGFSQVLPMEQINLHFTGDLHAITSAHNLCSAILDNYLHRGNQIKIDTNRIFWPRVIDMNDRSLREVTIGLGGASNGLDRTDRFDITAASEVMAILSLSSDYQDLRSRLGRIIVAETKDGEPVTANDIGAAGAMGLLLRDAFLPNLVQTIEGNPAFVHCGPFANIAHGNSSIIADKIALSCSEYVVTEAGFGAEMGAEKALNIKSLASGIIPSCIVLNVTIRSMKLHGGGFSTGGGARPNKSEISLENIDAVRKGSATNLRRHIRNLTSTKIPIVVSINKFSTDTIGEIDALTNEAKKAGADAVVLFDGHSQGGIGAMDLADAVVAACNSHDQASSPYVPIVDPTLDVRQKILKIATNVYGAQTVDFSPEAIRTLKTIEKWNKNTLPVCMAKNQYSFSHDKKILGAPDGFIMPIRELRINAGAGFIVAVCGSMMTMPGLPSRPAALDMDMDEDGNLTGVFG
ncbi:MAG: formate--tetrahydrofolate ligase [Euryarchaeota archaeon]|nr:formate--tetrahydrofolate ligase [Euryarchaeota archaeon]MBT4391678.1 formate--tetrahydrofolate ligase [Euryarchaeota archaeon]MBT4802212.1 formate--tetrahydrofolate ligase [Euryarchaeota archaeon]MBT5613736.1 formate--tetrahydrofolate ligase [Euryarchaeota archaeon]MBT6684017.1 formate--tetrahydrofolate ligase [Euryarchaeota archaeon]